MSTRYLKGYAIVSMSLRKSVRRCLTSVLSDGLFLCWCLVVSAAKMMITCRIAPFPNSGSKMKLVKKYWNASTIDYSGPLIPSGYVLEGKVCPTDVREYVWCELC
ncbi:hypothetical protein BU24DRAFT_1437 [Aaosphaeria arxii CBS 175.79]|uniref:Uncharacterized protein n=1 Tax=Aaosphaeria arxii CBS 175.79 TaxID=1450172 RepID=A0A6A5Y6L5_9PLEO|nr:uncharacterized protein BU24DRAFT_1437 [Aaosphaeria arxii CBS 175.79]KAF2020450.1 hypothetical protein BU24DRAFT_1437 [Aaosphaeria arxii CBS 175.79]